MAKRTIGFILMVVLLILYASSVGEEQLKTDFTIEELLADYDQLWDIMDNSYPFLPVLEERGVGLEDLHRENRALIGSRVTDLKGFYWLLGDMFHRMENLAHLEVVSADIFKTYQSLADQYDLPDKALVFDPQTRVTYSYLGADDKTDLYAQNVPVKTDYFPEVSAAYFRFPSFGTSIINKDNSLISECIAALPDVKHIIIDITGNAGGNTDYWQYTIVSVFAERYEWKNLSFVRITPLSAPFYHNNCLQLISALPDGFEKPDFVNAFGMTHYAAGSETYPKADYTGRQITAPLRRWLLVDEGVFSAAESFAGFCKNTGWATLVGRITRGDGARVRGPIMVRLNNTGLLARFTVESAVNEDASPNAVTGTIPDYPCKPNESPLETCLRLIRNLP